MPLGLVYNGTTYIYRKNLQGDIIAILDSTGTEVCTYTYNAWGRIVSMSGSAVGTIGQANPFRYRGYYYDNETGYYYLNSRYYDPTTGRFLNADGYVSTGQGLLGCNMFAYCGNNPVNRVDRNGEFFSFIENLINNIGNSIQSMFGVYAGCGGAAIADGPLPFGDIAAGIIAAGTTIFAVGVGVYDTVIRADNMPKEDVDEKDKDKKRPEIQTNYWRAELINHAIVPLYPLTYSQARIAASEEKNILCMNFQSALAIVKFYPSAIWDSAHGCKDSGYLDHFHLSSAHKNHIWYFG